MDGESAVVGDEPLVDGMHVTLRLRRDFTVTDAERLLAAARNVYREFDPDADDERVAQMVSCAADAIYILLERAGILGDAADDALAGYAADGLDTGGQLSELSFDESFRLPPGRCYFGADRDVFARPADRRGSEARATA